MGSEMCIRDRFQPDSPSLLLAFHLGIGHHFGLAGTTPESMAIKVERPIPSNDGNRGAPVSKESFNGVHYTVSHEYKTSSQFSMHITLSNVNPSIGGTGTSDHASTIMSRTHENIDNDKTVELDSDDDDPSQPVSEATWKQRYTRLRAQMQKKDQALSQYKRKIVESVMADI